MNKKEEAKLAADADRWWKQQPPLDRHQYAHIIRTIIGQYCSHPKTRVKTNTYRTSRHPHGIVVRTKVCTICRKIVQTKQKGET